MKIFPVSRSLDAKTGDRTEKEGYLRTVASPHPSGGSDEVNIWYSGGRLCYRDWADDGESVLVPLRRVGNPVRKNADGTYRTYVKCEVPYVRGGERRTIMEPTFRQEQDGEFNRAENIRQIPPGDPDYERLMGRRSDAEAANRQVDDHLYLRRARSLGAKRQLFDLIAHAFVTNAIAQHRHRTRAGPPAAIAA
jgi:hypothetical protein